MSDRKLKRNIKSCLRYKNEGRLEKNKKRALRRHIRANPTDVDARAIYRAQYSDPDSLGFSSRGRKLQKRYMGVA